MTFYTDNIVLFDGASANSSDYTSSDVLIADYERITLSYLTVGAAAATLTVEGSNDNGLTASIQTRSTLTSITQDGTYTVDPGVRWLRAIRPSAESQCVVQLQLRT